MSLCKLYPVVLGNNRQAEVEPCHESAARRMRILQSLRQGARIVHRNLYTLHRHKGLCGEDAQACIRTADLTGREEGCEDRVGDIGQAEELRSRFCVDRRWPFARER